MKKSNWITKIKYAVGEILIISIGLLIALQTNNWNEERKNAIKEKLLIGHIIEDLNLDTIHINQSLSEVKRQKKLIDDLIAKVFDSSYALEEENIGLLRYSSDFRPITQRNHSIAVSSLKDDMTRQQIQNYFLQEDEVLDIFLEYVDIVHNKVRPYLSSVGMHNLNALRTDEKSSDEASLHLEVLEEQLSVEAFQQLLYERRLKTDALENLLEEILIKNQNLVNYLKEIED